MSLVYVCRDELGNYSIEDDPLEDSEPETSDLPAWAIRAGNIMFAIGQPKMRKAGWTAFSIVERAAMRGHPFARQIREGLRRIAKALQAMRQKLSADPLAEMESIHYQSPDLLPESGGSIRA
jgi:hypothetical protein